MRKVLLVGIVGAGAAVVAVNLPDIKRYLKMRSM